MSRLTLRRRSASDRGFSLIEVLAALFVFSLVTLGVVPLFATALRGSNVSRTFTVGKNLAVQAMERIRGLPFHRTDPVDADLDLLDLYLPAAPPSGQPFTTACIDGALDTALSSPGAVTSACPSDVPAEYDLIFTAEFVDNDGTPETDYSDYLDDADNVVEPVSTLVRVIVRSQWKIEGDRTEGYELESLVGDVRFGRLKLNGVGQVSYGVRVLTSLNTASQRTELVADGGGASATLQLRSDPGAEFSSSVAQLDLDDVSDADNTVSLDTVDGATLVMNAPPDDTSGTVIDSTTDDDLITLNGDLVAGIGQTQIESDGTSLSAAVGTDEEPIARGAFSLDASDGDPVDLFVTQPGAERGAELKLAAGPLVAVNNGAGTMTGNVNAITQATRVDSLAHLEIPGIDILPVEFSPGIVFPLIRVTNFTADASCAATPASLGTNVGAASWSGELQIWTDDGNGSPGYVPLALGAGVDSDGTTVTTGSLSDVEDTRVYADPDDTNEIEDIDGEEHDPDDLYLFPTTDTFRWDHDNDGGHLDGNGNGIPDGTEDLDNDGLPDGTDAISETFEYPGYLRAWTAGQELEARAENSEGRTASADISEALNIQTVQLPTTGAFLPSSLTVSIGSLGCESEDFR